MGRSGLAPGDPERLGGYWLAGRLGQGGQGVVYDAYDETGRRVAVKVLHGDVAADPVLRNRFAREAAAAQRVASFCTARLIAAETTGPKPYIVSEYVEGPSLRRSVEMGGVFEGDRLMRLAVAIATALTAVHEAGVVHRDLKPDNVLIGPDGPRVIDFGIAKTKETSLSFPAQVVGTPPYMAPETLTAARVGPAADVFAWGATVLFAATGHSPFEADSVGAVMHRVLTREPSVDMLPEPLRSLAAAALDKDPEARPAARDLLLGLVGKGSGLLDEGARAAAGLRAPRSPDTVSRGLGAVAEDVYAALGPAGQEAVPRIMLRMVVPGDSGADTVRRAALSEFAPSDEPVLAAFIRAGLLFRDESTVRPAGAALLRAWPRLHSWLEAERTGLPIHRRLGEAARLWEEHGRKPGDLYQGTPLEIAREWATTGRHYVDLNALETRFLDEGTAATRRAVRRRRLFTTALATLTVVAVLAGLLAEQQRRAADAERTKVAARLDEAVARSLAGQAGRLRPVAPETARLLGVAAWRTAPVPEARTALLESAGQRETAAFTLPAGELPASVEDPPATVMDARGGRLAVVAGTEGRIWDLATRRQVSKITGIPRDVYGFQLSPDGTRLAMRGDRDRVWDGRTGRVTPSELSSDGFEALLAQWRDSGDGTLPRWFPETSAERWGSVSGDGRYGALVRYVTDIQVWDLNRRTMIGTVPEKGGWPSPASGDPAMYTEFSPDGRTLAVLSEPGVVKLYRPRESPEWPFMTLRYQPGENFGGMQFSGDGRFLAIGGGHEVTMWRIDHAAWAPYDGIRVLRHPLALADPEDVRFGPDDRTLVVGDGVSVRVLDVADLTRPKLATGGEGFLVDAAFSPDGSLLATLRVRNPRDYRSRTATLALWDTATGRRRARLTGPWADPDTDEFLPPAETNTDHRLAFSPDGRTLAVAGAEITLVDAASGKAAGTLARTGPRLLPGDPATLPKPDITLPAFDPAGRRLVAVDHDAIVSWDVAGRRQESATVLDRPEQGWGLAVRPDGGELSVFGDRGVSVAAITGAARPAFPATRKSAVLRYSGDGRTLLVGDPDGSVRLWDAGSRQVTDPPLRGHSELVTTTALAGNTLATGSRDDTVRLWDLTTREQVVALSGHTDDVVALAVTPDGTLLSAGRDGVIGRTDLDPGRVARAVCDRAGRTLTADEWARHVPGRPYRDVCTAAGP
ncbi:WD40 repeat domain-containing serine/threonine protein kinase [Planobispora takensis]|uniref:Protein kinase domain-containing protein n=1 Tax=Planobispora takensis TaxID=1367882 RepID=A0A8J3WTI3_9ACTN|nr:WD40 repeat domain-containing serine/threonine-protein kinase [Planobispora takensis]GII01884.1 hypothetical protein Pta02_38920 [Planobispora takensis]